MPAYTMKFNRRKFIKRTIIAIASLEAIFLIKEGISKTDNSKSSQKLYNAGSVESFEKDKTYPFLTGHFFLKRFSDGGFIALSIKCTHLGCVVHNNLKTGGFNCPCHSSQFNKFGEVLSAPAARPLDTFPITIKNGELLINTTKPIKRKEFNKSQLTYA